MILYIPPHPLFPTTSQSSSTCARMLPQLACTKLPMAMGRNILSGALSHMRGWAMLASVKNCDSFARRSSMTRTTWSTLIPLSCLKSSRRQASTHPAARLYKQTRTSSKGSITFWLPRRPQGSLPNNPLSRQLCLSK